MQTLIRLWAKIRRLKLPRPGGQGGFTLIELLVVVFILGILAAVVTVNVARFAGRGEKAATAAKLDNVQLAFDSLMADEKALVLIPSAAPVSDFSSGGGGTAPLDGVYLYPGWLRENITTESWGYCWNAEGLVEQKDLSADPLETC